jgi:cyanate permease
LLADAKVIGDDSNQSLSHQIRSVCLDWKVLFYIFIYMGATAPIYAINSFLPPIIEDMLHTNATNATNPITELLTVPPYIASCLTIIISSWNAGRLNERSNHIMILLLIQISGFLYLTLAEKYLYIGAMIVGTSMLSTNALTLSWLTNNIGGQTKRAVATALVVAFTGIGAIVSEQIYRESGKVLHNPGHWIVIGILCFTFILVLLLKLLLKYENRRRRNLITAQLQTETVAGERPIQLVMVNFVYITRKFFIFRFFSLES